MNVRLRMKHSGMCEIVVQQSFRKTHNHEPHTDLVKSFHNRTSVDLTDEIEQYINSLAGAGIPQEDVFICFPKNFPTAPFYTCATHGGGGGVFCMLELTPCPLRPPTATPRAAPQTAASQTTLGACSSCDPLSMRTWLG